MAGKAEEMLAEHQNMEVSSPGFPAPKMAFISHLLTQEGSPRIPPDLTSVHRSFLTREAHTTLLIFLYAPRSGKSVTIHVWACWNLEQQQNSGKHLKP